MMNENVSNILKKNDLPVEILDFIIKDTDGTIRYDLESIEELLCNGATAYSDLAIYNNIAENLYI